jgi:hypothetical protein
MRKEIELGDVLVANNSCIMEGYDATTLTVGEQYIVESIHLDTFDVIDDEGDLHTFGIEDYEEYFDQDFGNPEIEFGKCYTVEAEKTDIIITPKTTASVNGSVVNMMGDYIGTHQTEPFYNTGLNCVNRRITETPEKLNWLNYCLAHNKTITEEEYNAIPKPTPGISWISFMEEENFSKASSEFITPLKKNIKKKHLLKDLETLVIKGIDLCEMVRDLQKDNFELINRIVASEKRNLELLREIDVLKEDCNQLRLCCKIN